MSKRLLLVATLALAGAAAAEQTPELNPLPHHFPTKERFQKEHAAKITTEVRPIGLFYKAEAYHQQYDEKTGRRSCPLPRRVKGS